MRGPSPGPRSRSAAGALQLTGARRPWQNRAVSSANDANCRTRVWAVLRFDDYQGPGAEYPTTVQEVLASREEAEAEVTRLRGLGMSGVRYAAQVTRYYPAGRTRLGGGLQDGKPLGPEDKGRGAQDLYQRATALADDAWDRGYRYDAAELVLSMSKGATSGEILGDLFLELHRQKMKEWVRALDLEQQLLDLQAAISDAFTSIGQPPPEAR